MVVSALTPVIVARRYDSAHSATQGANLPQPAASTDGTTSWFHGSGAAQTRGSTIAGA